MRLVVEVFGAGACASVGVVAGERLYHWRLRRTLRRIAMAKPAAVEPLDPRRLAAFLDRQGVDRGT